MSFSCCGVKYSKNDPETYWCIETDIIKTFTKKWTKGQKVHKEMVETLTCKKNGCIKVYIKRFGKLCGKFKVLEVEKLNGNEAAMFLMNTADIRIRQPQKEPQKAPPVLTNIPLCFGKAISETEQRRRYDGDKYWSDKFETIEFLPGIEEQHWIPDIYESKVKVSKLVKSFSK